MYQGNQHQQINDPYRANRNSPFTDPHYAPSEQSMPYTHSHTGSISNYSHQQDPYSRKRTSPLQQQYRPDTPLPNTDPIYPDQELPSFDAPQKQAGPIYQDNTYYDQEFESQPQVKQEMLVPVKKKPWWARLGIQGRWAVFGLFTFILVVGIVWYFVWPRNPTLFFLEAGLADNTTANYSNTTMEATWSVNFTVNNMVNWVPTNIQNFDVSVIEVYSGEIFGRGSSGRLTLRPQSLDQIINVPISINLTRTASNPLLRTLLTSCWPEETSTPKESLNIKFRVVYYIAGIVWRTTSVFAPQSFFVCP
ncbi:hypothetical protein EDC96DRAFT_512759 [Choanephora cucurbitarum]|nr:hypothetical protein EDC96DRAFT_512759 [Choanephora cucurbitarum]